MTLSPKTHIVAQSFGDYLSFYRFRLQKTHIEITGLLREYRFAAMMGPGGNYISLVDSLSPNLRLAKGTMWEASRMELAVEVVKPRLQSKRLSESASA